MVIYYSKSGNTALYAKATAELTNDTLFQLEETNPSGFGGSLVKCALKKTSIAKDMPNLDAVDEITLCSPVWAANMAPVFLDFFQKCKLTAKTINVVLTCASAPKDSYTRNVLKALKPLGCNMGTIHVFTVKGTMPPTIETAKEQIKGAMNIQ